MCKFWFSATVIGGSLNTTQPEAAAEHIVEASWLSRAEMSGLQIFPPMLREEYWVDRVKELDAPRYVGLRRMEVW
jgi:hypothetical protein